MDEQTLYGIGKNLITTSERVILACRQQNFEDAIVGMKLFVLSFGTWAETLLGLIEQDEEHVYFPDAQTVSDTLVQVMQAQEMRDYVLLADYLELLAIPLFYNVQDGLRAIFGNMGSVENSTVYEQNLASANELSNFMTNVLPYELEETNVGYATLSLSDEKGNYYIHSNVNPMLEGKSIAQSYYDPKTEMYWVIGLGLGYHVKALLDMADYIQVCVYESDVRMIRTMLSVLDVSNELRNGRLRIICDQDHSKLIDALKIQNDEKIVVLASAIRNIKEEAISTQVMQYFVKESGVRKSDQLMASNFYQNCKNCVGNVCDISETAFRDKVVFIVSAGPSMLKNVELLKDRKENTVVLAVSTVYRKLLNLGIRPDYVIHSDAQKKTFSHLRRIEETIPLLVLSTAYEGCARLYPGECYMICQKDYDLAELEAERKGYECFETGGSVATVAVSVAVKCGAKQVVLIGQDLAYTDGLAHAKGVSKQEIGEEQNLIKVDGYNGDKVESTLIFADLIKWFSNFAKEYDQSQNILINATEGGARIEGIKQKPLRDVI